MKKIVLLMAVALSAGVLAQEPTKAPTLDASTKELLTSWAEQGSAKREVAQAHYTAMLATAEGKAYQAAISAYRKRATELNAKVEQRVPGYIIDFDNGGRLIPKPTQKPTQ